MRFQDRFLCGPVTEERIAAQGRGRRLDRRELGAEEELARNRQRIEVVMDLLEIDADFAIARHREQRAVVRMREVERRRRAVRAGLGKRGFSRSTVNERDRTRVDTAIPAKQVAQDAVRDDPACAIAEADKAVGP